MLAKGLTGSGPIPDSVVVSLLDSGGTGSAPPTLSSGSGLAGLTDRLRELGGTLTFGPQETGWAVRARLPLTTVQERTP